MWSWLSFSHRLVYFRMAELRQNFKNKARSWRHTHITLSGIKVHVPLWGKIQMCNSHPQKWPPIWINAVVLQFLMFVFLNFSNVLFSSRWYHPAFHLGRVSHTIHLLIFWWHLPARNSGFFRYLMYYWSDPSDYTNVSYVFNADLFYLMFLSH